MAAAINSAAELRRGRSRERGRPAHSRARGDVRKGCVVRYCATFGHVEQTSCPKPSAPDPSAIESRGPATDQASPRGGRATCPVVPAASFVLPRRSSRSGQSPLRSAHRIGQRAMSRLRLVAGPS
jgi:hypothetical protein